MAWGIWIHFEAYGSWKLWLVFACYHTKHVLRKQDIKRKTEEKGIQDDISDSDSEDEDLEEVDDLNSIDW